MDIGFLNTAIVPVIVGICAIVGYLIKNLIHNDRVHDFIPTVVCLLGLALAIVNAITGGAAITLDTIFAGMASGLASTGLWEMLTHWINSQPQGDHVKQD